MIAAINPDLLVAIIGMPAALITSIGTVWLVSRRGTPPVPETPQTAVAVPAHSNWNGHRFVTQDELREVVTDIKGEMRAMESRQSAQLELIVTLLKNGGRTL